MLERVGHREIGLEAGGDSQTTPGAGGHQFGEVPCEKRHSRVSGQSSRSVNRNIFTSGNNFDYKIYASDLILRE